jgi:hypothetical protein
MKMEIQQFACPIAPYRGVENLGDREFNAQLQFFAWRVCIQAVNSPPLTPIGSCSLFGRDCNPTVL